ncbi:MAG: diacylglycerol kinase family lipid kinase [Gemmatimonadota bacterium]|nr:diacylglycerol kinase family lipid kinase [Gemmatimonadota bacterium]MDE2864547.1 diacylglycerol kinase family lipid kinase [Gemmatimonadota bacterium]MXV95508.1 diacylglycerol kinase family lipid kinase [Gemmatimonadota bacterium]MYB06473.1 diacylglycerol kinase family lipid kinase [Gemmatimonadota bacterium]MYE17194.1 diacylglycerol kinase family lipid kinase [Gemmatimonadota bacterium]
MSTFVIFNPASGRGRGARRIPLYRELLDRHLESYEWESTTGPGEEAALADRALAGGARLVVAVGGDGTWSQVADRVVASGRSDVVLGLLASGTGNDFARSLGLSYDDPEHAVAALAAGRTRRIDVGRVISEWRPCARPETASAAPWRNSPRHFLNLVGFGFDVAVIDATQRARFLKGELLYKATAAQQLFFFRSPRLHLSDGGGWSTEGRHLILTVSNGRIFGGGFPIAPDADLQDGRLDACAIADASPLGRARLFNLAAKGRHVGARAVSLRQDEAFTVRFDGPLRYEVDGDVLQSRTGEVRLEAVPSALSVIVP